MKHSNLEEFWQSQNWNLLRKANGWEVSRAGDIVTLELPAGDGEIYRARCLCDDYPFKAPSVLFVNSENSKMDVKAWPKGKGEFMKIVKPPQNCFLCMQLTREGLQHHKDWANQPNAWNADRNTLIDIFNFLSRLLNSEDYQGRGG